MYTAVGAESNQNALEEDACSYGNPGGCMPAAAAANHRLHNHHHHHQPQQNQQQHRGSRAQHTLCALTTGKWGGRRAHLNETYHANPPPRHTGCESECRNQGRVFVPPFQQKRLPDKLIIVTGISSLLPTRKRPPPPHCGRHKPPRTYYEYQHPTKAFPRHYCRRYTGEC